MIDFDAFDQQAKDSSLRLEVGIVETLADLLGEVREVRNHQSQRVVGGAGSLLSGQRLFFAAQAFPNAGHTWFEIGPLDPAVLPRIQKARQATLQRGDRLPQRRERGFIRRTAFETATAPNRLPA